MYRLFESIRVEHGVADSLEYHQRRVYTSLYGGVHKEEKSAQNESCSVDLAKYVSALELPKSGLYKLKIIYSGEGIESHSINPYAPRKISTLRLVDGGELHYDRKYLDRSGIEALLGGGGGGDDILIVKNGLITDTSFSNVALFDADRSLWITPAAPLLEGTCRAALIDSGTLTPAEISADSILKPGRYTKIVLINAMLRFDENRALSIPEALF